MRYPLISIITIVYNGELHLEQAMCSVFEQTYSPIEYIIIDGGSTDGSINIIKKHEHLVDYWVSEIDKGISDAFNKGVSKANGEIIAFLNSDDWYQPDAIENIVSSYLMDTDFDVYYAVTKFHKKEEAFFYPSGVLPHLSFVRKNHMAIAHPSTFVRKKVFDTIGDFNKKYKIAMDYDFLLRAMINGATFKFIDVFTTNFRTTGISSIYPQRAIKECVNIKEQLLSYQ